MSESKCNCNCGNTKSPKEMTCQEKKRRVQQTLQFKEVLGIKHTYPTMKSLDDKILNSSPTIYSPISFKEQISGVIVLDNLTAKAILRGYSNKKLITLNQYTTIGEVAYSIEFSDADIVYIPEIYNQDIIYCLMNGIIDYRGKLIVITTPGYDDSEQQLCGFECTLASKNACVAHIAGDEDEASLSNVINFFQNIVTPFTTSTSDEVSVSTSPTAPAPTEAPALTATTDEPVVTAPVGEPASTAPVEEPVVESKPIKVSVEEPQVETPAVSVEEPQIETEPIKEPVLVTLVAPVEEPQVETEPVKEPQVEAAPVEEPQVETEPVKEPVAVTEELQAEPEVEIQLPTITETEEEMVDVVTNTTNPVAETSTKTQPTDPVVETSVETQPTDPVVETSVETQPTDPVVETSATDQATETKPETSKLPPIDYATVYASFSEALAKLDDETAERLSCKLLDGRVMTLKEMLYDTQHFQIARSDYPNYAFLVIADNPEHFVQYCSDDKSLIVV